MVTSDNLIFGRENDIVTLLSDLNKNEKTIRLVVGESGVGKTKLLNTFYSRIKDTSQKNNNFFYFIGYYSSLIPYSAEEYPVHVALANLVHNIKESASFKEDQKIILNRFGAALKEFSEQEGKQIVEIYKSIFISIAKEFSERRFILIFDQIEVIGKSSIDFLLNLINFLSDKFHIFLAFQIKEYWQDQSSKSKFDYTERLIISLNGNIVTLNGLRIEEIDEWIQKTRNRTLSNTELHKIREYSGGLPIILEHW